MIYPDYVDAYPRNAIVLDIGYEKRTRAEKHQPRNKGEPFSKSSKRQLPKRRKYHKGGHNKDRYHK
jgi:hypothetical protein